MTRDLLLIGVAMLAGAIAGAAAAHICVLRMALRRRQAPPYRNPGPIGHVPPRPFPSPPPPPTPPAPIASAPRDTAARQAKRLEQLARNLLDPDMFGHAVTPEVRNEARTALGLPIVPPKQ